MQVRALLYTSTLTNAIMEAMAAVETAVLEALAHQTTLYPRPPAPPPPQDRHRLLARASQPVHEALALSGFSGKAWTQGEAGLQSKKRRGGVHALLNTGLENREGWACCENHVVMRQ